MKEKLKGEISELLNKLILSTPSGEARNDLTSLNILVMELFKKFISPELKDELVRALGNMLEKSRGQTWCNQFDNGYERWIPTKLEQAAIDVLDKVEG
jgi:hypothetical protein